MNTVHLVDGSLYAIRAWFALPDEVLGADGEPVQAVHGFTRFLLDLLERERPTHLAVAFDASRGACFRNEIYPEYKANRPPAPPKLRRQLEICREVAAALGAPVLSSPRYEADDLIGSALAALRPQGFHGVIVSADKDLAQLIGAGDEQRDPAQQRRWDAAGVEERLGVRPDQVADFLALAGDTSDNVPGVPGIGAKTAAALLGHFGSLEELLARADEVPFLRLRGAAAAARRLREHAAMARLARALTGIALDAPVPATAAAYAWRGADAAALQTIAERLHLGPLSWARMRELAGSGPLSRR